MQEPKNIDARLRPSMKICKCLRALISQEDYIGPSLSIMGLLGGKKKRNNGKNGNGQQAAASANPSANLNVNANRTHSQLSENSNDIVTNDVRRRSTYEYALRQYNETIFPESNPSLNSDANNDSSNHTNSNRQGALSPTLLSIKNGPECPQN